MRDDRAVSVTVGYVLNFAVAALLLSALLIGGGGLIESQTNQVTHDELTVTGQQLAGELSSADRLNRSGDTAELSVRADLSDRTAAGSYTITIEHDGQTGTIELRSVDPEVVVSVPFRSESDVQNTTVRGGPLDVRYNESEDRLEVTER